MSVFGRLRRLDGVWWFALFVGALFTLTRFHYGSGDHAETLLVIRRLLDPKFISSDYFANLISTTATVRTYYVLPIALLARWLPLDVIFFAFTLIVNLTVALATAGVARALFRSKIAAFLAVAVSPFFVIQLGTYVGFYSEWLLPIGVAKVLLMVAIWALVTKRLSLFVIFSGAAALVHPQEGPVIAGMCFLGAVAARAFSWRQLATAGALLALFAYAVIAPQLAVAGRIDDAEYILIRAFYHTPDHHAPSVFQTMGYIRTALLLVGCAAAWLVWRRLARGDWRQTWFAVVALCVVAAMIVGVVFVEIYPIRTVVMAQPFRYRPILDWIGMIVMLGVGVLAVERVLPALKHRFGVRILYRRRAVLLRVGVALIVGVVTLRLVASTNFAFNDVEIDGAIAAWLKDNTPTDAIIVTPLRWEQIRFLAERALVVEFKGGTTMVPETYWGEWVARLQALYGIPFTSTLPITGDPALSDAEKARRIRDVYLETARYYVDSLFTNAAAYYRALTDTQLRQFAADYDADYAVLYVDTVTAFPVLYATRDYKVVRIE